MSDSEVAELLKKHPTGAASDEQRTRRTDIVRYVVGAPGAYTAAKRPPFPGWRCRQRTGGVQCPIALSDAPTRSDLSDRQTQGL